MNLISDSLFYVALCAMIVFSFTFTVYSLITCTEYINTRNYCSPHLCESGKTDSLMARRKNIASNRNASLHTFTICDEQEDLRGRKKLN